MKNIILSTLIVLASSATFAAAEPVDMKKIDIIRCKQIVNGNRAIDYALVSNSSKNRKALGFTLDYSIVGTDAQDVRVNVSTIERMKKSDGKYTYDFTGTVERASKADWVDQQVSLEIDFSSRLSQDKLSPGYESRVFLNGIEMKRPKYMKGPYLECEVTFSRSRR